MATHLRVTTLKLQLLEARDVPATLIVDDDFTAPLPGGRFDTIQGAVDAAAANDTIRVRAGSYDEQVTFGPAKSGIRLLAQGKNVTITTPADALSPLAIVRVNGATGVVVDGFTVAGPVAVADLGAGILVEGGGSAVIRNNTVTDIAANPPTGDQFGFAIQVGGTTPDGTPTAGSATVENNTVLRYQKSGIFVANPGSKATVRGNTVVGAGPTSVIAQNGIQVSDGAIGVVTGNTVSNNVFNPAGTEATGILVIEAGGVTVSGNRLLANEIGLAVVDQSAPAFVASNLALGSTQDGFQFTGVSGAFVANNVVTGSGRDGIRLTDTDASVLIGNRVSGAAQVGLRVTGDSESNVILFNRLFGSGVFDLLDDTDGSGTAGTANFYLANSVGNSGTPGL